MEIRRIENRKRERERFKGKGVGTPERNCANMRAILEMLQAPMDKLVEKL